MMSHRKLRIPPPVCPPTRNGGTPSGQRTIAVNAEEPAMRYKFITADLAAQ